MAKNSENMKKTEEIAYAQMLKERVPDFPSGQLQGCEEPDKQHDVLVHRQEGIIGIEVTKLHQQTKPNNPSGKAQVSEREIVVDRVCQLLKDSDLPPLAAIVSFASSPALSKRSRDKVATQIYEAIVTHYPREDGEVRLRKELETPGILPDCVDEVDLVRGPYIVEHQCSTIELGWAQKDFCERLQERITKKNGRYEKYMTHCQECWLLIVAQGAGPSSFFNPSPATLEHVYISSFARAYFLHSFEGRLFRLITRSP